MHRPNNLNLYISNRNPKNHSQHYILDKLYVKLHNFYIKLADKLCKLHPDFQNLIYKFHKLYNLQNKPHNFPFCKQCKRWRWLNFCRNLLHKSHIQLLYNRENNHHSQLQHKLYSYCQFRNQICMLHKLGGKNYNRCNSHQLHRQCSWLKFRSRIYILYKYHINWGMFYNLLVNRVYM